MVKNIAGVDIGKEISYAYISSSDKYLKFNNNTKGITGFIKEIKNMGFVMLLWKVQVVYKDYLSIACKKKD